MSMNYLGDVVPGRVGFATITPEAASRLFFISTYETRDPRSHAPKNHGYQRPPDEKRVPKIAGYFGANNHRDLITPLITSVRVGDVAEAEEFKALFNAEEIDEIKRRWDEAVVSVVDGQHRFLGLREAWRENEEKFAPAIPVMMYFGLSFVEEAELFNTINVEQRKLPKALIETTRGDIVDAGAQTYAQRVREIAFALARDEDSVWVGQVNMTGARNPDKPVTYEGLRRSTGSMFPAALMKRISDSGRCIRYAKEYWRLVSEVSEEAWNQLGERVEHDEHGEPRTVAKKYRLKELVGVASLAKLGHDVIASAMEHPDERKRMVELTSRLGDVDWEKRKDNRWMASQAGFAGQKDLYEMLYAHVYDTAGEEG